MSPQRSHTCRHIAGGNAADQSVVQGPPLLADGHDLCDLGTYLGRVRPIFIALGADDSREFGGSFVKIVVDDDVIELVPMRHVAQCVAQAPRDDLLGVGLPAAQAPLEFITPSCEAIKSVSLGPMVQEKPR